jgi:hypothetical protein
MVSELRGSVLVGAAGIFTGYSANASVFFQAAPVGRVAVTMPVFACIATNAVSPSATINMAVYIYDRCFTKSLSLL